MAAAAIAIGHHPQIVKLTMEAVVSNAAAVQHRLRHHRRHLHRLRFIAPQQAISRLHIIHQSFSIKVGPYLQVVAQQLKLLSIYLVDTLSTMSNSPEFVLESMQIFTRSLLKSVPLDSIKTIIVMELRLAQSGVWR